MLALIQYTGKHWVTSPTGGTDEIRRWFIRLFYRQFFFQEAGHRFIQVAAGV